MNEVFSIIQELHQLNCHIWYDEGIDVSENWMRVISLRILKCAGFVVFLSQNSIVSESVLDELHFAVRHAHKGGPPIIPVYLDTITLPEELELALGRIQALHFSQMERIRAINKLWGMIQKICRCDAQETQIPDDSMLKSHSNDEIMLGERKNQLDDFLQTVDFESFRSDNTKKISVLGLANAGKTSIIRAVNWKLSVLVNENLRWLKPTTKVERTQFEYLGFQIHEWDFGGQDLFREAYLGSPERYFSNIDLMIYVIDLKDPTSFEESARYLKVILDLSRKFSIRFPIVFLLHKHDDIQDPEVIEQINLFMTRIRELFTPIINGFETKYFLTSIYVVPTIIHAFTYGLRQICPPVKIIEGVLEKVELNIPHCVLLLLFDSEGNPIGEKWKTNVTIPVRKKIYDLYDFAFKCIFTNCKDSYEFSDRHSNLSGILQRYEIRGKHFYLLVVMEEMDEEVIKSLDALDRGYPLLKAILSAIL